MEFIRESYQRGLSLRPLRTLRGSQNGRSNLLIAETHAPPIDSHMDAPFVLGTAPRTGPVDHDLSFDGIYRSEIQQVGAAAAELVEDVGIVGDHPKEQKRLEARAAHHPFDGSRDLRLVGRLYG